MYSELRISHVIQVLRVIFSREDSELLDILLQKAAG
jgi:hypothetical protein